MTKETVMERQTSLTLGKSYYASLHNDSEIIYMGKLVSMRKKPLADDILLTFEKKGELSFNKYSFYEKK